MLNIIKSNRMEHLMDAFVSLLRTPLPDPFTPEWVGVQSRGMKHWIAMETARQMGVCANLFTLFPRDIIDRLFAVTGSQDPARPCFQKDWITLAIMGRLPDMVHLDAFRSIRNYIQEDISGVRLYQISKRIASIFDDYQVYRPDMILSWKNGAGRAGPVGGDALWQQLLWNSLCDSHDFEHTPRSSGRFLSRCQAQADTIACLVPRLSFFGISAIPPLFLRLVEMLSRVIDVYFFILTPTREFWGDIQSDRSMGKQALKSGIREEGMYMEQGNPLLASLGTAGKTFGRLLEEISYHEPLDDLWVDPALESDSMLAVLHSDILNLVLRRDDQDPGPVDVDPGDTSVSIHACHSPMREAQVLKDQLLALFDADPFLKPHDVIVMMPDIESYAPYIDAVFSQEVALPHTVSDRKRRSESRTVQILLQILRVAQTRLLLDEVLDILEHPLVGERFGIEPPDVERIRILSREAGICWGMDADHRKAQGLPGTLENTWQFGLERLMLGYAMPECHPGLFQGILPAQSWEGGDAELLGRIAHFCHTLFTVARDLAHPRTIPQWCDAVGSVLATMVATTHGAMEDARFVLDTLKTLRDTAGHAGFQERVSVQVALSILEEKLGETVSSGSFAVGGITVCNLMPMRSIPFKVVALMGLNDQVFPGPVTFESFNLITRHPMAGDRVVREEQRYLFLEALLSARKNFIITYTGMSSVDNSLIPPSTVVSEFTDVLGQSFRFPASFEVTVFHPLQPYNHRYFSPGDHRLFSYSDHGCRVAMSLMLQAGNRDTRDRGACPVFMDTQFASEAANQDPCLIQLEDLIRFFRMPVEYLLRNCLGLRLEESLEYSDGREPLELDGLERYTLGQSLLESGEAPLAGEDLYTLVKASGRLPHGTLGKLEFQEILHRADPIRKVFEAGLDRRESLTLKVDIRLGHIRIQGSIDNIHSGNRHLCWFSGLNAPRKLSAWICHLVLQGAGVPAGCGKSVLTGWDAGKKQPQTLTFPPMGDAWQDLLKVLAVAFCQGIKRPMPFFPKTSWAFAEGVWKSGKDLTGETMGQGLKVCRPVWYDLHSGTGESLNRYVQLVFGKTTPLMISRPWPHPDSLTMPWQFSFP
ncbi:MAG: exodeoxyribonuclease V subunit gamma [Pseudomonadota bacterium]